MLRIAGSRFITKEEFNRLSLPSGSTIPTCGSVFITLSSEVIFDNPELNQKIINAGVWHGANSSTITYEIARFDPKDIGSQVNIDRYFISALSGGTASISNRITNFPEHHSNKLPLWYKLNEEDKNV